MIHLKPYFKIPFICLKKNKHFQHVPTAYWFRGEGSDSSMDGLWWRRGSINQRGECVISIALSMLDCVLHQIHENIISFTKWWGRQWCSDAEIDFYLFFLFVCFVCGISLWVSEPKAYFWIWRAVPSAPWQEVP